MLKKLKEILMAETSCGPVYIIITAIIEFIDVMLFFYMTSTKNTTGKNITLIVLLIIIIICIIYLYSEYHK